MKRILIALAALVLMGEMAHAQQALVVSSCGSITYDNPTSQAYRPLTQDTAGKLCTGATASGTVASTQSGTWTVQPGNTPNTSPWLVTLQPGTSGGSSTYSGNITTAGSGAGTGGVTIDSSPGQLYGWAIYNANSSVCYIQLFDQTQALTNLGTTTPKISFGIPANGAANITMPNGIPFATAITAGVTTTRAGSTACSSGLDINLWYK
jgi:hypothetical protein